MAFEDGYVLISRDMIKNWKFTDPHLAQLMVWCISKASYMDRTVPWNAGRGVVKVQLKRGQFIFGRQKAASELAGNENSLYKRMLRLKRNNFITIDSNSKFSIITVVNYEAYQDPENYCTSESTSESTSEVPAKYQRSNTYNKVKKGNKGKKVEQEVRDIDSSNEESHPSSEGKSSQKTSDKIPYDEILFMFQKAMPNAVHPRWLTKGDPIPSETKNTLRVWWGKRGKSMDNVREFFTKAYRSDWVRGQKYQFKRVWGNQLAEDLANDRYSNDNPNMQFALQRREQESRAKDNPMMERLDPTSQYLIDKYGGNDGVDE